MSAVTNLVFSRQGGSQMGQCPTWTAFGMLVLLSGLCTAAPGPAGLPATNLKFTSPLPHLPLLVSETVKYWADEVAKRSGRCGEVSFTGWAPGRRLGWCNCFRGIVPFFAVFMAYQP